MDNKSRSKVGVVVAYSLISLFLILVLLSFLFYQGTLDAEKRLRGFVELPNNYGIFQVSSIGPNLYEIAVLSNDDKQIVKPNVIEIGWDDRYVLYKRIDGVSEEIGLFDTNAKIVKTLPYSIDNIQKLIQENGISQNISLKSVSSLWPDISHLR